MNSGGRHDAGSSALSRAVETERNELGRDNLADAARVAVAEVLSREGIAPSRVPRLDAAISSYVEYVLCGLVTRDSDAIRVPDEAIAQVRRAARAGASLPLVLRCCVVAHSALWRLVADTRRDRGSAARVATGDSQVLHTALLDRVVAAVTGEYLREQERLRQSQEARRADLVREVLSGDLSSIDELEYDFDTSHVALVASGSRVQRAAGSLAAHFSGRLLAVLPQDGTAWIWLGGVSRAEIARLGHLFASERAAYAIAVGAPADGHAGFCSSHRQAVATLKVAQYLRQPVTHYVDVALVAATLENEGLARSLVRLYATPLGGDSWGTTARQILRAYFSLGCNASAAASLLGLERRTVANHIRRVEQIFDRPIHSIQAELEIALRLEELTRPKAPHHGTDDVRR